VIVEVGGSQTTANKTSSNIFNTTFNNLRLGGHDATPRFFGSCVINLRVALRPQGRSSDAQDGASSGGTGWKREGQGRRWRSPGESCGARAKTAAVPAGQRGRDGTDRQWRGHGGNVDAGGASVVLERQWWC
jgi:hypothetical protein